MTATRRTLRVKLQEVVDLLEAQATKLEKECARPPCAHAQGIRIALDLIMLDLDVRPRPVSLARVE